MTKAATRGREPTTTATDTTVIPSAASGGVGGGRAVPAIDPALARWNTEGLVLRELVARLPPEAIADDLIAVLLGVFGIPVPEGLDETIARAIDSVAYAAAMIAAIAGAVMKEKGHAE